MNSISRLIYGLLLVALTGCNSSGSDAPPVKSLEFGPFKQECYSWFYAFCPAVRSVGTTDWGYLYGGIEGFQWEWGYHYLVEYRSYPVETPLADAPSVRRVLERIVSKDAVPSDYEFTLGLHASDPWGRPEDVFVTKLQDGLYQYRQTEIECHTPETCSDLDFVIEQDLKFLAVFTLREEFDPPIVLKEIVCTEPNDDHTVQCEMMALR